MRNQIEIWNPNTGTSVVTLRELREMICERRLKALTNRALIKRGLAKEPTVHTTDLNNLQIAAHFPSYKIRQFHKDFAITIFNKGGCQVAKAL